MNDEITPRRAARQRKKPVETTPATPIPAAYDRTAKRGDCLTGRVRASFNGLQLLPHAAPDITMAAGEALVRRYDGRPVMQSFVFDIWRTCQAWAEEWTVSGR